MAGFAAPEVEPRTLEAHPGRLRLECVVDWLSRRAYKPLAAFVSSRAPTVVAVIDPQTMAAHPRPAPRILRLPQFAVRIDIRVRAVEGGDVDALARRAIELERVEIRIVGQVAVVKHHERPARDFGLRRCERVL